MSSTTEPQDMETLDEILDRYEILHAKEVSEYLSGTGREALRLDIKEFVKQEVAKATKQLSKGGE